MNSNNYKNTYSKKEIYSKLLDIAGKYTNITNEDYLKSGLFGYLTESMAMMIKDSSLHKSMLYKESFLNTAVIPKSIYNWAKMFNINISNATPAYADIEIMISKEHIDELIGKKTLDKYDSYFGLSDDDDNADNNEVFIIDKRNPIMADDYYFMLEHSIKISKDSSGVYKAEYITTEPITTAFQTIKTPVLSIFPRDNTYVIKARAYQYKTNIFTKQIPNNSILSTKIHTYNFDGQFAGLSVSYRRANDSEKNIETRYSNINNSEIGTFCYYNLNTDHELQITFSNHEDAFMPKSNDILKVCIYTTEGSNVPTYYSGDAIYMQSDDDFKAYPIIIRFNPNNIIGGKDVPSLDKIRDSVINEISSRNVIITESDLNNYFAILTSLLESINDGKVQFIKKRDDIVRRLFSAYILLRDGLTDDGEPAQGTYLSKCIPTNTIDIDFPIAKNSSRAFGTVVRRKTDKVNEYVYAPTTEGLDGDYYIIPFYMYVSLNPVRKIKYIYNLADSEVTSSFTSINTDYYIVPTSICLKRDLDGYQASDTYTVDFKFITDFDLGSSISKIPESNDNNELNIRKENNVLAKIKLNADNNIVTSKKQSDEEGGLYETTISVNIKVAPTEFDFNNGSTQYIQIMTDDNSVSQIPEDVVFELSSSFTINSKTITFVVRGDEEQTLFQNLDNMLFSDVIINYSSSENDPTSTITSLSNGVGTNTTSIIKSITVKDVPVVHGSFFKEDATANKSKFINQLFAYISLLKENIDKLETNTFFDIKFYNTYGSAHIYNSLKTNLDLDIKVILKDEHKNNESVKSNIRSYIRQLVDESNKAGGFRYSAIVTQTDSAFADYIDHIEFYGLNDTFNQYINKLDVDESLQVPEWLNISKDSLELIKFG